MDRAMATALIDQLCRSLPARGTEAAAAFDYTWFRERIQSVAGNCRPEVDIYIWQYALWQLDKVGLLDPALGPKYRA